MKMEIREDTVIHITAQAAEKILGLMDEREINEGYLRVFVDGLGCSGSDYGMAFSEKPLADDTEFHSNGIQVLLDPFSLMCLEGATVDYVETSHGLDFEITNPNEAPASACGGCSQSRG